jgi:hypothetical protein
MSLALKEECERCGASLGHGDVALICSYECTFCADCATQLAQVCPNCGGELVRRPRRVAA